MSRTAASERERLERGEARAGDLERAALWGRTEVERVAGLRRSELGAAERERNERKRESDERQALARADADSRAVERHRERWQVERERALEKSEEEEALDRFNTRTRAEPARRAANELGRDSAADATPGAASLRLFDGGRHDRRSFRVVVFGSTGSTVARRADAARQRRDAQTGALRVDRRAGNHSAEPAGVHPAARASPSFRAQPARSKRAIRSARRVKSKARCPNRRRRPATWSAGSCCSHDFASRLPISKAPERLTIFRRA